jgi:hypothetical protein
LTLLCNSYGQRWRYLGKRIIIATAACGDGTLARRASSGGDCFDSGFGEAESLSCCIYTFSMHLDVHQAFFDTFQVSGRRSLAFIMTWHYVYTGNRMREVADMRGEPTTAVNH